MTPGKFLSAIALVLALTTPLAAQDSDTLMASGTIERIDRDGRIYVRGQSYIVTEDTEILDQLNRSAAAAELAVGVPVEVTYENESRGATAKVIIATLMR